MKRLLTRTFAAFALISLIAVPAVVAETPDRAAVGAPEAPPAQLEVEPNEPVEVQVPADLPNRGHACVLPPPQQRDPCICPLVFDPVCGCNDVTYTNSCFASCEVRTWEEGACS